MKKLTAALAILACIYLDSIFLARINLYGVRPDMLLAVTVGFGVLTGSLPGGVFGLVGGLCMDILFGRMLGLNAALYLAAGIASGFFYQKFYADNVIIPAVTAAVCGVAKDILYGIVLALTGARFSIGLLLVQYILPCALMTALAAIPAYLICKPLLRRQVSRSLYHR